MEGPELEAVPDDVDALVRELDQERARSIAGVEPEPALAHLFASRSRAGADIFWRTSKRPHLGQSYS